MMLYQLSHQDNLNAIYNELKVLEGKHRLSQVRATLQRLFEHDEYEAWFRLTTVFELFCLQPRDLYAPHEIAEHLLCIPVALDAKDWNGVIPWKDLLPALRKTLRLTPSELIRPIGTSLIHTDQWIGVD